MNVDLTEDESTLEMSAFSQLLYSARKVLSEYLDPDRVAGEASLSMAEHKALFETHGASFGKYMPYMGYCQETDIFSFDDGNNYGIVFDVKPLATEGRSTDYKREVAIEIVKTLSNSFQEYDEADGEWVLQQYRWKDTDLESLADEAYEYADAYAKESPLAEVVLKGMMKKHFKSCAAEDGLFTDNVVTRQPFVGGIERTKLVIYRRLGPDSLKRKRKVNAKKELETLATGLEQSLKKIGIDLVRNTEFDFFYWLIKFFNDKPEGQSSKDYFENIVPKVNLDGDLPENVQANLFLNRPRYEAEENLYTIGETHHKLVRVNGLNGMTDIGHLTGEVETSASSTCITDQLPAGTMMCMTSVFCTKEFVQGLLNRKEAVSQSNLSPGNAIMREKIQYHRECLGHDHVRPTMTSLCFYVRGRDKDELHDRYSSVCNTLVSANLTPIQERGYIDPLAANAFIYNLPMCFDPTIPNAKKCLVPIYLHDVGNLSFFFGREVGSGNPLLLMFNRSGSVLTKDIMVKKDRQANAHMLVTGTTGAGKSATLVYLTLLLIAIKRPRLYIIEAGGSFRHVVGFIKDHGMTVNEKRITPSDPKNDYYCPNLCPFSDLVLLINDGVVELDDEEIQIASFNQSAAPDVRKTFTIESGISFEHLDGDGGSLHEVLMEEAKEEIESHWALIKKEQEFDKARVKAINKGESFTEIFEESEQKDRLGEIELIAFSMITSGEEKEMNRFYQSDKRYLRQALMNAGKLGYINNFTPNVQTVADELFRMAEDKSNKRLLEQQRVRLFDMAGALENYTQGFDGDLLNKVPANDDEIFPDVDVTVIDLATLAKPGKEALLGVVYVSILQRLNALAEKYQMTGRLLIKITDECHLVTKNVLTSLYIVKVIKLWRKLNGFAWMATQNLKDFPGEAEKMLSMMEWIMMLLPTKKEVELLEALKPLTDEQKTMALCARKQEHSYTEGCLFGADFNALFRCVQPSESLAMAGTDGEEKLEIDQLAKQYNCPHKHASLIKAYKLDRIRGVEPIRYEHIAYTGIYDEAS
ncbi:conjugative transfer ATPase [Vibrio genomosp. F10 str. ZF-129]|uniref:Conjugative transfer ATPase n=2 Tax=Vibrio genomosp. F10 TaxID=723171 RepID=A0A1E5BH93_9VIBR|nr:conjugative transfer ATPase [Vibrio genomosp. F10 str. ZF-129]